MKKNYGLQLRIKPQNRQPAAPPPAPRVPGFFGADDEEDHDVNMDIARQATKKKIHKDVEEQQKKALEEDPTVFDYDGVYDQMKEDAVRPLVQDRQERKSKYIERLMAKAKEREREHEIIYERKLAKERSKDEHLFQGKDKFLTKAYKKKLEEQEKWLAEERLRELREEKEDVTKKSDLSDFYFNLSKNVAFGAKAAESSRQVKPEIKEDIKVDSESAIEEVRLIVSSPSNSGEKILTDNTENTSHSGNNSNPLVIQSEGQTTTQGDTATRGDDVAEQLSTDQDGRAHHKRNEDAVAAAKARFLARKRAKVN